MCNKIRDFVKRFFLLFPITLGIAFFIFNPLPEEEAWRMALAAWSSAQLFCLVLVALVYIALDDFC